jgi:hypothetical protein
MSDVDYFLKLGLDAASVYRPLEAGTHVQGTGVVRIRRVIEEANGQLTVEGTLVVQEVTQAGPNDLIGFRLGIASRRVDFYAHPDSEAALAHGEYRFRTFGQAFPAQVAAALREAEGVRFPRVPFQILPLLSTPCDLYAIGVLAVRILFVDRESPLPVALDEALSLARQVGTAEDLDVPLAERVKLLFEQDERWRQALGPQRILHEEITPDEAMSSLPEEVWWETVAMVLRLFPGVGPDSICRDYGDAPAGGLHTVFQRPTEDLLRLLAKTRSLITVDYGLNREVRLVIQRFLNEEE